MTIHEKQELKNEALRYMTQLLPPEKYGEDERCNAIQNILEQLASDGGISDVRSSHIEDIRKELQEFFANNMVSYWRIEEFELQENYLKTGFNIIPKEPYFDESYSDDEADKRIEAIGKKYGMKLGWIYWVYPK